MLLFLSDDAHSHLVSMAMEVGYIRSTGTAKGLTPFLNELSRCTFEDNRPDDIRESDIPLLESGRFPYWTKELQRRQRRLQISDAAVDNYLKVAEHYGIVSPTKSAHGTSYDKRWARVAATLEAIGVSWLVPTNITIIQPRAFSRPYYDIRKNRQEIEW